MTLAAYILAAGRGTRLLPFSENKPKPLLPIINKPLLGHSLDRLVSAGIEEIGIVIARQEETIPAYIKKNYSDLEIQIIIRVLKVIAER